MDHPIGLNIGGQNVVWFEKSEKDAMGEHLMKTYDTTEKVKDLCDNIKKEASKIFDFFDLNKDSIFDSSLYEIMWEKIREYHKYHFSIKYLTDYFSPADLEKYMPILVEARVYAEPVFEKTEKLVRNTINQISKKTGIEESLVSSFTKEELCDYFDKGILPKIEELKRRKEKAILWSTPKDYGYFVGEEADKIEKIIQHKITHDLKGEIGYKGIVRGTVRIINNPNKYDRFNEGDVLVTGMTRPEFLPLINKSSAILTDAGGVLSHAAIMARELKKPCIIGMQVVTQVLKDGDLVEIDANVGIVRILKSVNKN